LTQGSFVGKTGPMDPARRIPENPKFEEKYYPNPWTEDRNLKTMHKRVNSQNLKVISPTNKPQTLLGERVTESD
jgi:hypothetical protein